jgi:hypothetical protein
LPLEVSGSRIPNGWDVVLVGDVCPACGRGTCECNESTPLTFVAEDTDSSIKMAVSGTVNASGLQYRMGNTGDWQTYSIGTIINLSPGDIVQFQNSSTTLTASDKNYVYFVMSGKISAHGNVQSLVNYSSSCGNYCFYYLFKGCKSLIKAPKLLATTLTKSCYYGMFQGSGITEAPELPQTTLGINCYTLMFAECTDLTTASELPATTLTNYCYYRMYDGCTNLVNVPEQLPAKTLTYRCYYNMFRNCSKLLAGPKILATTLADQSLTNMFYGCSSLNSVHIYFSEWPTDITPMANWVYKVSKTGTFTCPAALPEERGANRIPEGWEIVRMASEVWTTNNLTSNDSSDEFTVSGTLSIGDGDMYPYPYVTENDEAHYMWNDYTEAFGDAWMAMDGNPNTMFVNKYEFEEEYGDSYCYWYIDFKSPVKIIKISYKILNEDYDGPTHFKIQYSDEWTNDSSKWKYLEEYEGDGLAGGTYDEEAGCNVPIEEIHEINHIDTNSHQFYRLRNSNQWYALGIHEIKFLYIRD